MTDFLAVPDGYTCPQCGELAGWNTYHQCPGRKVLASPPPSTDERIAAALERIAGALERAAGETITFEQRHPHA